MDGAENAAIDSEITCLSRDKSQRETRARSHSSAAVKVMIYREAMGFGRSAIEDVDIYCLSLINLDFRPWDRFVP